MQIVYYDKKVGTYILPSGVKELLSGKSIEEQLNYYRVSHLGDLIYYAKDISQRKEFDNCYKVNEEQLLVSIIIDEGIIVGINLKTEYGVLALFLEQGIIINDDMDRRFLFIVPENFNN